MPDAGYWLAVQDGANGCVLYIISSEYILSGIFCRFVPEYDIYCRKWKFPFQVVRCNSEIRSVFKSYLKTLTVKW
jgi:hypothetical protein